MWSLAIELDTRMKGQEGREVWIVQWPWGFTSGYWEEFWGWLVVMFSQQCKVAYVCQIELEW